MIYKLMYRASIVCAMAIVLAFVVLPLIGLLPLGESLAYYRQGVFIGYGLLYFAGFPETWLFRGFENREHRQLVALAAGLSGISFLALMWSALTFPVLAFLTVYGAIGAWKMLPMIADKWRKPPLAPYRIRA